MEHSIAGLPIPPGLIAVIQAGKWNPPTDPQVYIDVFGELPDHPMFYWPGTNDSRESFTAALFGGRRVRDSCQL